MPTKAYFECIRILQDSLVFIGVGTLIVLPVWLAYFPDLVSGPLYSFLFALSLFAVFLVMSIRPLADLFPRVAWVRPLVILRKGFGVFSASIIVAIMFSRILVDAPAYLASFVSAAHWSLTGGAILAPLGDISAFILLVTSNKFSKRVLGANWKRVQKLAYLYFYAGALYEYLVLGQTFALAAAVIVTMLVLAAFAKNRLGAPRPVLV